MFAHSSLLFVPGSRPDRFAKACAAGAGLTVIDLEDAVAPADKEAARSASLECIAAGPDGWGIRINAIATAAGVSDLAALAQAPVLPQYLLVPMVECARDVEIVGAVLDGRCPALVPLIETPCGLRHALEIARAPFVAAVMFGGGDFAGELGVALAWQPLLAARHQIVLACAEAHVPAIDVPYIGLDDDDGLMTEARQARELGFAAKAAIHPRQIAVIDQAFRPGEADIAEAEAALAAFADAGGQAIRFRGRMLEAPIVKRYRAVIARSRGQQDA